MTTKTSYIKFADQLRKDLNRQIREKGGKRAIISTIASHFMDRLIERVPEQDRESLITNLIRYVEKNQVRLTSIQSDDEEVKVRSQKYTLVLRVKKSPPSPMNDDGLEYGVFVNTVYPNA